MPRAVQMTEQAGSDRCARDGSFGGFLRIGLRVRVGLTMFIGQARSFFGRARRSLKIEYCPWTFDAPRDAHRVNHIIPRSRERAVFDRLANAMNADAKRRGYDLSAKTRDDMWDGCFFHVVTFAKLSRSGQAKKRTFFTASSIGLMAAQSGV